MPKEWTGDLVGLMHNHKISFSQLADKLGVTNRYVSMVLNGHREPAGAEERFRSAVRELISDAPAADIVKYESEGSSVSVS